MTRYDMRILNGLLDSFEKSVLSRGENKVNIHIAYQFTRKTMPEYFDESSLAYDEIHAAVQELEQRGLLTIVWNQGKEGHIIKKVLLNEEKLPDAYSYVKRTAKKDYVEANLELLEAWRRQEEEASVVGVFCAYLMQRIQEGKSVKEFIDLTDTKGTEQLLQALSRIENNQEECYIREFSIRLLGIPKNLRK